MSPPHRRGHGEQRAGQQPIRQSAEGHYQIGGKYCFAFLLFYLDVVCIVNLVHHKSGKIIIPFSVKNIVFPSFTSIFFLLLFISYCR
jgi:hypothetical protein